MKDQTCPRCEYIQDGFNMFSNYSKKRGTYMKILSEREVIEKGIEFDGDVVCFSGVYGQQVYNRPMEMGGEPVTGLVGVAKSYYKIGNTDFVMPENYDGAYTDIIVNNEIYGRVIRTHKDVKPIFVSAGNYITLETATEIVNRFVTTESHIPIPTRLADIETHRMRAVYKNKESI